MSIQKSYKGIYNEIKVTQSRPQLATGKHHFSTTKLGSNIQTEIKRRKIKNRPYSTDCNTVIIEEFNYELSLQHKRALKVNSNF
jgi:hypothetical protein